MKLSHVLPPLLAGASLVACGGSNDGSNSDTESKASFTLGITDAPVDNAENVFVQFNGVTLVPAGSEEDDTEDEAKNASNNASSNAGNSANNGGSASGANAGGAQAAEAQSNPNFVRLDFAEPITLDLLALQGGSRDFLVNAEEVPAGSYSQIRLDVSAEQDGNFDSYIVVNGEQHELFIPSGSQTGLKLNHDIVIGPDVLVDYTIDFDLRKSVVFAPGRGYILKPTLRLVETEKAGQIAGVVDPVIFDGQTCSDSDPLDSYAVYVFAPGSVTPDDLGSGTEAVSSAGVSLDPETSQYVYTAAFLEPGEYTVAATCQADADAPDTDDVIGFVGTATVTVEANTTTPYDFLAAPDNEDSGDADNANSGGEGSASDGEGSDDGTGA